MEIKYRAWDSYQKKMYEWDEICEMDKKGSLTLSNLLNNRIKHIKPMQFIGLTDKNGKEIYEGDKIRDYVGIEYIIKFIGGAFTLSDENNNWVIHSPDKLEVIGHIHENKSNLE